MGTINRHWYSENEGILYPLDDYATSVDNDATMLPTNIVVDLNLRWPEHLGSRAFVAAVSVGPALVSVTIQACSNLSEAPLIRPLAAVAVRRPVLEDKQYALAPQADGVGGWIVFGSGANGATYNGRFGLPRQGLLLARAARAYPAPPVSGICVAGAERALSGVVRLRVQPPLQLTCEDREIEDRIRRCLVLRLVDDRNAEGVRSTPLSEVLAGKQESVWQEYAGPCGGRPESRTCGDPQPVEFISGVAPDCDGILTLELTGCAQITAIGQPSHGVSVSCDLGLTEVCRPERIPASDGTLPGEVEAEEPASESGDDDLDAEAVSESVPTGADLPFQECFGDSLAQDFAVKVGGWEANTDDQLAASPCADSNGSYASTNYSTRNILVWEGDDTTAISRLVQVALKLLPGPAGSKCNGGIVLNYRQHASTPNLATYHTVEIDYDAQELRIRRFNGSNFVTVSSVVVPGLQQSVWYRMEATIQPGRGNGAAITARLVSDETATIDVTLGPVLTNNYGPSVNGRMGLATNRALARFAYILVQEV